MLNESEIAAAQIAHTSDWHIGPHLYGRKRYEEFEAFLTWLAETIQQNEIDALLVAGDVFDTSAPSNRLRALMPVPVPGGSLILSACCRCRGQPRFPVLPQCSQELLKALMSTWSVIAPHPRKTKCWCSVMSTTLRE